MNQSARDWAVSRHFVGETMSKLKKARGLAPNAGSQITLAKRGKQTGENSDAGAEPLNKP